MSDRQLTDLHPDLQSWYQRLVSDLANSAIAAKMIQGWRDPAYQDQLHAQGVSPLTGASSHHCFCLPDGTPASKAFDLGIFNADGSYVVDGNDPRYAKAGSLWEQYATLTGTPDGMVWGGRFVHPKPDPDHFQIA
jgi:peptidoglycan LD-endopeptidase CwlK